jgi:hypothetical protein
MHQTKTGRLTPSLVTKISILAMIVMPVFGLAAKADSVVKGYVASKPIQTGMVVAIDKAAAGSVKPTPASDSSQIFGVAIDPSDAPIALVGNNSQVFVATTGTYPVLVSAQGGVIQKGDYISMSSTDGIAGKAHAGQKLILGRAESGFDGKTATISTSDGVNIGRVFVTVAIAKNPVTSSDPTLPAPLRKLADTIGNRSVPVIRVYIALLIFLVSLVATVVVLWSGVRSSMISLGRNPLSRHAIFSGMYKVVFTGIGVFVIGLAGVYLLLKV